MTYVRITTLEGDRWDLIAWRAYNDPAKMQPLIDANPHIPITPVIAAGTEVWIPVIDRPSVNVEDVPPWKR